LKWPVAAAALLAVATGAVAITVGITQGGTELTTLVVTYLANISTASAIVALVLWARDTLRDEVRSLSLILTRHNRRADDDSGTIRKLR
jgi:hypothetical protein